MISMPLICYLCREELRDNKYQFVNGHYVCSKCQDDNPDSGTAAGVMK